jgi:hypothetical protein
MGGPAGFDLQPEVNKQAKARLPAMGIRDHFRMDITLNSSIELAINRDSTF